MNQLSKKTVVFGRSNDTNFWSDKPKQNKIRWFHIHWYNVPYHPIHYSPDRVFKDEMIVTFYKCRCGKLNPLITH